MNQPTIETQLYRHKDSFLFASAKKGQLSECASLLGLGANPNWRNTHITNSSNCITDTRTITTGTTNGDTPFLVAIRNGHISIASLFLTNGADVGLKSNIDGDTIMHIVARVGDEQMWNLFNDLNDDHQRRQMYALYRIKNKAGELAFDIAYRNGFHTLGDSMTQCLTFHASSLSSSMKHDDNDERNHVDISSFPRICNRYNNRMDEVNVDDNDDNNNNNNNNNNHHHHQYRHVRSRNTSTIPFPSPTNAHSNENESSIQNFQNDMHVHHNEIMDDVNDECSIMNEEDVYEDEDDDDDEDEYDNNDENTVEEEEEEEEEEESEWQVEHLNRNQLHERNMLAIHSSYEEDTDSNDECDSDSNPWLPLHHHPNPSHIRTVSTGISTTDDNPNPSTNPNSIQLPPIHHSMSMSASMSTSMPISIPNDENSQRSQTNDMEIQKHIMIIQNAIQSILKTNWKYNYKSMNELNDLEMILRKSLQQVTDEKDKLSKKMLEEEEEKKVCVVCQVQVKSILLMPCRHLCVCNICSQRKELERCPLCREWIKERIQVYA